MKPQIEKQYSDWKLQLGGSTWDEKELSIRGYLKNRAGGYNYKSPELPLDVLVEMVLFAYDKRMLSEELTNRLLNGLTNQNHQ